MNGVGVRPALPVKSKSQCPATGKPVTMKDISRETGVTVATVSLVFKRSPQIPESTRRRVLGAAERLGYRKSPYISAHMSSRRKGKLPASSPVLAFVTAEPRTAKASAGEFDIAEAYFQGVSTRARERGYRVDRFSIPDSRASARRLGEILYARNVAGLLVAPLPEGWKTLDFPWERFPVVALGFTLEAPGLNRVSCDAFQVIVTAMERCYELGYRRIGLAMTGHADARVDRRWLAAYLMEQENRTDLDRLEPLLVGELSDRALSAWIGKQRPELLITPWGGTMVERLTSRGRAVPGDLGVVSLDCAAPDSPVTGIFQNRPRLGARAVDLLVGSIERNECGVPQFPNTLVVGGLWCPGNTLRGEGGGGPRTAVDAPPEGASRILSMREFSRRVGLHVSTVSLSLRGSPAVAEKTRVRVLREAERLGFRANPFVSRLMQARRRGRLPGQDPVLAFVTAFPSPQGWRRKSRIFAQYFAGARRRAEEKGFVLEEMWVPPGKGAGREVSRSLHQRSVQGVLLAPLPRAGAPLELVWEWFCVAGFGFTLNAPPIHRVANDHFSSMRTAVRECHRLGYRRIGLALSATASARVQYRWLASYLVQQRELPGIVALPPLIARRWTAEAVTRWMNENRPEVIIASSALLLLRWLESAGYTVPGDVGLVALGSPEPGEPLTGVHERAELLGERAADVLVGLVQRGQYGISNHPNTLLVDGIWNPGETVRPATAGRRAVHRP